MKCFQQSFSLYESGSDLTCLWRTCLTLLPLLQNIQILHLQSQCQCLFFTELLCGRKRRCDDGGWRRVEGLFSRTPYVVSFGGLLVSVYAWQVSFSLFMVSVHPSLSSPTCPSASGPGTAQCLTSSTT